MGSGNCGSTGSESCGGLEVDAAGSVSVLRVPSVVGDPRGQNVSAGRDGGGGPLSPVVESEGVSSVDDDGVLGEADDVVNLPARGGSGENCIAREFLSVISVGSVGGADEDVGRESGGGHQVGLKNIIIIVQNSCNLNEPNIPI